MEPRILLYPSKISRYSVSSFFQIYKLSLKSEHCSDIHRIIPIECICAFAAGEEGDKLRLAYNLLLAVSLTSDLGISLLIFMCKKGQCEVGDLRYFILLRLLSIKYTNLSRDPHILRISEK